MKAEYKRDLQNNYLILKAPGGADAEDYRFRMAEQNRIPGLLPFRSARKDGELYLQYEITSMQPLENIFEKRTMGYDDILLLLTGIREVLEAMQKFLLEPAQLVFDPVFLYIDPDHYRVQFCYLPGSEGEFPITMLAEYILRHLDHREQQAVALGYGFYQKAAEENFSLQKTLREILAAEEGAGVMIGETVSAGSRLPPRRENPADRAQAARIRQASDEAEEADRTEKTGRAAYDGRGTDGFPGEDVWEDPGGVSREIRESYGVVHRERKRRPPGKLERLFDYIHPAVLLSTLALLALLEIVFYLGMLSVTEAGGIFFLLISVEAMVNKFWRASKEKKKGNCQAAEEEDEMYRMLQEELYEMPEPETGIGETKCLVPEQEPAGMCLVCIHAGTDGSIAGQDIHVGASPVYVGKIQGESDVILDSPTVSRRHARLECRDGVCYVKDLNSRNGTFCNGRRLKPQEQCQFAEGDEISFAEVRYRAVLKQTGRHFP